MGRTHRPYLPGAAFHITARTQGKALWFTEQVRDSIEEIIIEGVASSDALLLAQTVMPNHFHIVLKQGMRPLGWVMQPVMRRIALLVQRSLGVEDHVFGAPFWSRACNSSVYLRRAIVYTNINARRAGLCIGELDYPWSTHNHFCAGTTYSQCELKLALPLFANIVNSSPEELSAQYVKHVEWRQEKDRCKAAGVLFLEPEPSAIAGDAYFTAHFLVHTLQPARIAVTTADLRDCAIGIWKTISDADIGSIQGPNLDRSAQRSRKELIAALCQKGYRVRPIAKFLRVSDSVVSEMGTKVRYASVTNPEIPKAGPVKLPSPP